MIDLDVIATAIAGATGATAGSARWQRIRSSAWATTWSCTLGEQRCFVKIAEASRSDMLAAEADGLRELGRAGAIRVPTPIAEGCDRAGAFVALEWLELHGGGGNAALGRALARLHRTTSASFGWHRDNTIGGTPQHNDRLDDWAAFFRDRRIAPQLALAARNGHGDQLRDGARLLEHIPHLLEGHGPQPSLLHGDLWSGNAGQTPAGEPVVFDPAVYYGDREADLAMAALFGGFDASFEAAYCAAWPLPEGHARRRTLYNLYHVLNHLNLFGAAYLEQAQRMMRKLLGG
jgi:fructosamine-3-kinase